MENQAAQALHSTPGVINKSMVRVEDIGFFDPNYDETSEPVVNAVCRSDVAWAVSLSSAVQRIKIG